MYVIAEIRKQLGCTHGQARRLVNSRKVFINGNLCTNFGKFEGELTIGKKKEVAKVKVEEAPKAEVKSKKKKKKESSFFVSKR